MAGIIAVSTVICLVLVWSMFQLLGEKQSELVFRVMKPLDIH